MEKNTNVSNACNLLFYLTKKKVKIWSFIKKLISFLFPHLFSATKQAKMRKLERKLQVEIEEMEKFRV